MNKNELLFYDAYEEFYAMAANSEAFRKFCQKAFGEDFSQDMIAFVAQIKKWLKDDGVFFVVYQEGDVMQKTENSQTTVLAKALEQNDMKYEVFDITAQTYDLLKIKRISAIAHKYEFEAEGHVAWYQMLIDQTECIMEPVERFREKMARYIYIIRK